MHLVRAGDELYHCEVRGRLKEGARRTTSPIYVGDWVQIHLTGHQAGVIESVEPRQSRFSRRASGSRPREQVIAVNVEFLLIVVAMHRPEPRAGFIDRAVVMAAKGAVVPVVCLNKIDLARESDVSELAAVYENLGYKVLRTSAVSGHGTDALGELLCGGTCGVVGQSGVGKSTLLNCIDPSLNIRTQELMRRHDRGRHTTTSAQLYELACGGWVVDTPGIKNLRLWDVARTELASYFVEMRPFLGRCRFRDCCHLGEPGCAVRRAVDAGQISARRYAGYVRIMDSL